MRRLARLFLVHPLHTVHSNHTPALSHPAERNIIEPPTAPRSLSTQMGQTPEIPRGRGAGTNPRNRFEATEIVVDLDAELPPDERPSPRTRFYDDASESAVTFNASPDIPFDASLNPYRGCEHGCSYCYARPFHEYLGFSAGLDFETRIMVKRRAPELLRKELAAPRWKPQMIALSGVTDPYQPVERRLGITRACLETLLEFRNPVGIVTKNRLVARDADILGEMARLDLCHVTLSLNSLDAALARKMEPRTSSPAARLEAISALAAAGVPVGIFIAPVVPGLNDHEIPAVLRAAKAAGARYATYILLRLPHGVEELFFAWVREAYPTKADRIEANLRSLRGGRLNSTKFGERFTGKGILAEQIGQLYRACARREGLEPSPPELSVAHFRRAEAPQLEFGF